VHDGKRIGENVIKSCNYSSVVAGEPGSKSIYAVGSDKKLKELADSQVNKDLDCDVCLTQLAISGSGRMLFTGTEAGAVRAYRFVSITQTQQANK
jgi:cilia- and flagella-associated protein 57